MARTLSQPRFTSFATRTDTSEAHPVPPIRGDGRMTLEELVGAPVIAAIRNRGELQFQAAGDTGVGTQEQKDVAQAMARDLDANQRPNGPLFFLNLGDIIYGQGKKKRYANSFYRPNLDYIQAPLTYDAFVLAIPGNHDGEVRAPEDRPSLSAYLENFCQAPGANAPIATSFGVTMPNQPGAYWWLDAPFLDLIGLYSNSKENDGMLGADQSDTHQETWLAATLANIAAQRGQGRKALVMTVHHPPYSAGLTAHGQGHPGSPELLKRMDAACSAAGIWPDMVLSAHSHNYQRYMRRLQIQGPVQRAEIPYLVVGTGGISLQPAPFGVGQNHSGGAADNVSYENALFSYGYARVTAKAGSVSSTFVSTSGTHRNEFETVTIDLNTRQRI